MPLKFFQKYKNSDALSYRGYISLSDASKKYGLNQNYLRVLILRNKLRAVKIGKMWVTTAEWIAQNQALALKIKVSQSQLSTADLSHPPPPQVVPEKQVCQSVKKETSFAKTGFAYYIPRQKTPRVLFSVTLLFFVFLWFIISNAYIRNSYESTIAEVIAYVKQIAVSSDFLHRNISLVFNPQKLSKNFLATAAYSIANTAKIGKNIGANLDSALGNFFVTTPAPPSPREVISGIREDLARIFTNASVPSVTPIITALRDMFGNALDFPSLTKIFGLSSPPETPMAKSSEKLLPSLPEEEVARKTLPVGPAIIVSPEKAVVREVVERKEIISTADTSVFQKKLDEINQYVLTQFSKVITELTDLGIRVDSKTPFSAFAISQKIDQLINPTIKSGLTIDSGTLTSNAGFSFAS
ncbi:MAG: hypothetical protein Q7R91_01125, partial [bacterium]|nr:hypothetical protein [bacterium]